MSVLGWNALIDGDGCYLTQTKFVFDGPIDGWRKGFDV